MIKFALQKLIRFYQIFFSPWVGHNCRYLPTCSQYSLEAIEKFGAFKGSYLMIRRLLRCHPFGGSGIDEVPAKFSWFCSCKGSKFTSLINKGYFSQTNKEQTHYGK